MSDSKRDLNKVLLKEIDLIQACINRMAQNSFMIKGWTISLVAVVLAVLPESFDLTGLCLIGIVATLCFWYLDAFFLRTEKLYRWKYEWVLEKRLSCEDFCYDLDPYNSQMWLLNKDGTAKKTPHIAKIMFTKTLFPIYTPLLILSIVVLKTQC